LAREIMTGVDAAWLHMDRAANTADVVSIVAFDEPVPMDDVRRVVEQRLMVHPRFRRRIVPDGLLGLATWEDDPTFALERHVVKVKLPRRGTRALDAFASEVASEPLDPAHPLWRMYLVDGHGEGSAIVSKLHHCIGDGFALVGVLLSLADELATSEPGTPHSTRAFRDVRPPEGAALTAWRALSDPSRAVALASDGAAFARSLAKMAVIPPDAPTILARPLSGTRRAAWSRPMNLGALREVAKSHGATVNDVVVSALTGALRHHLARYGEPVDDFDVRALVPVNLRTQPPGKLNGTLGNCFGLVFLPLPIKVRGSRDRLEAVRLRMAELKRSPDAIVSYAVLCAIGHLPRPIEQLVTGFFSSKASLVITNVPGPRQPLHLAGHLIRRMSFAVPHPATLGLGVSIMSYAGEVRVGARADVAVMPDPHTLVGRIPAEIDALRTPVAATA
jgi:diacylglycerol O-acyltransferase